MSSSTSLEKNPYQSTLTSGEVAQGALGLTSPSKGFYVSVCMYLFNLLFFFLK